MWFFKRKLVKCQPENWQSRWRKSKLGNARKCASRVQSGNAGKCAFRVHEVYISGMHEVSVSGHAGSFFNRVYRKLLYLGMLEVSASIDKYHSV
jgi:hypothetical protein